MPRPTPAEFKRIRRAAVIQIAVIVVAGLLVRAFTDTLGSASGPLLLFLIFIAFGQLSYWRLAFSPYEEVAQAVEEAERQFRENPPPPAPTSREVVRQWSTLTKVLIVVVFAPAGLLMLGEAFFITDSWGVRLFVAACGLAMLALPGALIWACMPDEETPESHPK